MSISIYNEFSDYVKFKGIKNVDVIRFDTENIEVTEEAVINQFHAIYAFHKKSFGFNGYLRNRLSNDTGKIIEEYKIYNKKLNKDIDKIKRDKPKNHFEELMIKNAKEVLNRGERCIREVYQADYLRIITRSMRRGEICLGNTDFNNLRKDDKFTYVVDFEDCSYNLVEMDCFLLLNRLKRKGENLNFQRLANEFCCIEELEDSSAKFIIALISYPYEFMRCCSRYREGKKKWSESKFTEKLIKALMQDGESLI